MPWLAGDEQLARAAAAGDDRAFSTLYRRYHQALYRYCLSLVRDPDDASDALQNTMMKALRSIGDVRRGSALKPWLFRIAHNEAMTLLRSRRAEVPIAGEAEQAAVSGPEEDVALRERLDQLTSDMQDLPERQRAALVMRELNGLEYAEIASTFRITPGAARQAVCDARTALHERAEGRGTPCAEVRRCLSDGDRRRFRGRRVRAHLRQCASCQAFAASLDSRPRALAALAPPLSPAAAAAILGELLGGGGIGGGGAAVAAAAGAAKGSGFAGAKIGGGGLLAGKGLAVSAGAAAVGGSALVLFMAPAGSDIGASQAAEAPRLPPASGLRYTVGPQRALASRSAGRGGNARRAAFGTGGPLSPVGVGLAPTGAGDGPQPGSGERRARTRRRADSRSETRAGTQLHDESNASTPLPGGAGGSAPAAGGDGEGDDSARPARPKPKKPKKPKKPRPESRPSPPPHAPAWGVRDDPNRPGQANGQDEGPDDDGDDGDDGEDKSKDRGPKDEPPGQAKKDDD